MRIQTKGPVALEGLWPPDKGPRKRRGVTNNSKVRPGNWQRLSTSLLTPPGSWPGKQTSHIPRKRNPGKASAKRLKQHPEQQLPEEAASWKEVLGVLRTFMFSNGPQVKASLVFLCLNPTSLYKQCWIQKEHKQLLVSSIGF